MMHHTICCTMRKSLFVSLLAALVIECTDDTRHHHHMGNVWSAACVRSVSHVATIIIVVVIVIGIINLVFNVVNERTHAYTQHNMCNIRLKPCQYDACDAAHYNINRTNRTSIRPFAQNTHAHGVRCVRCWTFNKPSGLDVSARVSLCVGLNTHVLLLRLFFLHVPSMHAPTRKARSKSLENAFKFARIAFCCVLCASMHVLNMWNTEIGMRWCVVGAAAIALRLHFN